jgi:4-amino-4-deoxy-L-arabinose transferase-like glycosyltransferase
MRNLRNLFNHDIVFIFVLLAVAWFYLYPQLLFQRPQSVHRWRQSDCTSLALNYYQDGMHFFSPQTHNLTSDKGNSGYVATSEVPGLYYTVAVLYKIFGYHEFIYRLLNTLIFLTGLFFLFRLFHEILQSRIWSSFLTLLVFSSPVLVYYGNNFLTDSTALSFSFIGWYYFIRYYKKPKLKLYYFAMLFFLLAASCKISAGISIVALLTYMLGEKTFFSKSSRSKIFPASIHSYIPFICIFLIVGSWALYARIYNTQHATGYFSTTTFPIWGLDRNGINQVLDHIKNLWFNQYFHPSLIYFLAALFLICFLFLRKIDRFLISTTLILFLGTILYCTLWFWTLQDHDYYTINLYILPVFILLSFFYILKNSLPKLFNKWYIKTLFASFVLFNIYYAHSQQNLRYNGWWNNYSVEKDIYSATNYLRSIGINRTDTIISLPDDSHCSLYLMNQKGWTNCSGINDSAAISAAINRGAKYLIVNKPEFLETNYLKPFLYQQIGEYGSISVFRLYRNIKQRPVIKKNFHILTDSIYIDAEKQSDDGNFFIASSGLQVATNKSQTTEKTYSGKYAIKLTNANQYGLTIRIPSIVKGNHVSISVKRSSTNGKGVLVASSNNGENFYHSNFTTNKTLKNDWKLLETQFTVPFTFRDSTLAVYLWNEAHGDVYFDDLKIIITKKKSK